MDYGIAALYALHVLFGILWFGGGLFSLLVVVPAISGISLGAMQEVNPRIGMYAGRIMPGAAGGTIVLGVITAIALGHFRSLSDVLASPYGITALTAFAIAVATHEFARLLIGPTAQKMSAAPPHEKPALLRQLRRFVLVEQAGFFSIFACMVLLRFGM